MRQDNEGGGRRRTTIDGARWARRVVLGLLVLGLLGALAWALRPRPIPVDLRVITRGPMELTIDEDGKTRVMDHYVVSAPLTGNLARIDLRAGDEVKEGDVIARMEPVASPLLDARSRAETEARLRAAEAAVRQAKASTERARVAERFARDQLARVEGLHARGSVAARALDQAQVEADTRAQELESSRFGERVARGEVEMARAALRRIDGSAEPGEIEPVFELIAPASGRVLRVLRASEGVVAAATPLLEIADPGRLEIVADLLTTDAVRVEPGVTVHIEQWGGPGPLEGRVRLVEPAAFTRVSALGVEEQRVNVLVDLQGDPAQWAPLGDGFRVEVRIVVWAADDVVQAPVAALFPARGGGGASTPGEGADWAVFVVDAEGIVGQRRVRVGRRHGLVAEILEGLAPGEQVVVHPEEAVREGVRVEGSPRMP